MKKYFEDVKSVLDKVDEDAVKSVVSILGHAIGEEKVIFTMGNGGSAACASHLAQDLAKGLSPESRPRVISLVDNISWMTAIANDINYDSIFSEQLSNLAKFGNILIAISGSGNSKNIVKAIKEAKEMGMLVISLLGFDGGKAKTLSHISIHVPCDDMGIVESVHSTICHYIPSALSG